MKTLDEIQISIETLKKEMDKAVTEAYEKGFDDGVATTPDFKDFHTRHLEPQGYGEDGEMYVVSGKLKFETAVARIYKLIKDDLDITKEEVENQTGQEMVALATGDQEYDYYLGEDRSGIFPAWVWRA